MSLENLDKEMAGKEQIEELPSKSSSVNHQQVETAIKFLKNPKVSGTPIEKQVSFLKGKGLTEDEINLALSRAGIDYSSISSSSQDNEVVPLIQTQAIVTDAPQSSGWRQWMGMAVVGAGFLYGAGCLVKTQVYPLIFGRQEEKPADDTEELRVTLRELRGGFGDIAVDLRNTFREIQIQLEEQRQEISALTAELLELKSKSGSIPSDTTSLSDVKNEVSSLKGLVLGRRQFPPTPFSGASGSTSIPAWQKMSSNSVKATNVSPIDALSASKTASATDSTSITDLKIEDDEIPQSSTEENGKGVKANQNRHGYGNGFLNGTLEGNELNDAHCSSTVTSTNTTQDDVSPPVMEEASEVSSSSDTCYKFKIRGENVEKVDESVVNEKPSDTTAVTSVEADVSSTE